MNSDMGESFAVYTLGNDAALLDVVSSANIACGFHAGDPAVMRKTVALAVSKGAAIGAHPGLPIGWGSVGGTWIFPRKRPTTWWCTRSAPCMVLSGQPGGRMEHVKAQGALYKVAAKDAAFAQAIAEAGWPPL